MAAESSNLPNWPRRAAAPAQIQPFEPACALFRRYLHSHQLKFTPERARILDAVLRKTALFEAEQVVDELKHLKPTVSRATVYRTLNHLQDAGIIRLIFFDKQSYYEVMVGRQSSDYLICPASGKVVEIQSQRVRELRDEICREMGYQPLSHRLLIFGLSPEAQKKKIQE